MSSMRQRLLLVAGWAVAAVLATLVSTGAVAVAGGQVTDRPLRPLTASEVAALAEECGTTERAPCLRQLDNSGVPTTTVEAAPDLNSSLNGGEDGVSPFPDDDLIDPPSEDLLDPGVEVDESLVPPQDETVVPEPSAEVVDLIGGRAPNAGGHSPSRIRKNSGGVEDGQTRSLATASTITFCTTHGFLPRSSSSIDSSFQRQPILFTAYGTRSTDRRPSTPSPFNVTPQTEKTTSGLQT